MAAASICGQPKRYGSSCLPTSARGLEPRGNVSISSRCEHSASKTAGRDARSGWARPASVTVIARAIGSSRPLEKWGWFFELLSGWGWLLGFFAAGMVLYKLRHYAAAARAEDVSGLPPTYISIGGLDLFLEENMTYADRLSRAGVPVELHMYPRAYHGFYRATNARVTRQAEHDNREALRHFLHG